MVVPGRVMSYLCTGRIDGVGGAPSAVNAAGSAPAAAGSVPALPAQHPLLVRLVRGEPRVAGRLLRRGLVLQRRDRAPSPDRVRVGLADVGGRRDVVGAGGRVGGADPGRLGVAPHSRGRARC